MKKDKVKQSALLQTIEFSGFPSVRFLSSLVVSSFFPLFWSVLFWSAPALPSSLFLLSFLLASFPGGVVVTVLFRYDPTFPSFVSPLSFPFTSLAGGVVWYCPLLSPSLPVSFPASLVFPFSFFPLGGPVRSSTRKLAAISPRAARR